MPLSRRTLVAAGTGVPAAIAGATGCGRAAARGPDLEQAARVPREPVTIRWWAKAVAAADGSDLIPTMVRAFRRRHPNIRVQVISAPANSDTARSALTTQIASGVDSPDVFLGDSAWPAQFGFNSLATPLDSVVPEGYWQRYPEELMKSLSYQGEVYAFPFYLDKPFLFYRKDLLRKHSLPVPRTWEELARTAARIQRRGDADYGYVWQGSVYEGLTCNVAEMIGDAGGSILNEAGTRPTFDSPEVHRAVSYLQELVSSGVSPSSVPTFLEQDSLDAFAGGRTVFMRNWFYAWAIVSNPDNSAVADRVGVTLRPGFEGKDDPGNGCLGGWCHFVNPHSRNLGAAVAFARFFADEEGQLLLARQGGQLPSLLSVQNSKDIRRSKNPAFRLSSDVRLTARPTYSPQYPMVSKVVYTRVNQAISGGSPVPRALAAAQGDLHSALRGEAL